MNIKQAQKYLEKTYAIDIRIDNLKTMLGLNAQFLSLNIETYEMDEKKFKELAKKKYGSVPEGYISIYNLIKQVGKSYGSVYYHIKTKGIRHYKGFKNELFIQQDDFWSKCGGVYDRK